MTNYYDQISKDELMKDKCLILLIESISYCKVNNQDRIKRSNLLRLCDNKINELSDGDRPKFGGSFETCLKKYSDPSAAPDNRLFTVERSTVRHNTQIYPNFELIEKQLRARRILKIYTDPNIVKKTIHAFPSGNLQVSATVGVSVRRADSRIFLQKTKSDLCKFLKSDLVEITVSKQENSNTDLYLSENIMKQLDSLVERFASDNDKTKEHFSLVLEYSGIPTNLVALERSGKQEIFFKNLCLYFEKWLIDYHRDSIAEEETASLRKGDLESLSGNTKEKLKSFLSSIEDHCNSSLEADNPLLQIITELDRTCLQ
jgi:hypothetical protein